VDPVTDAPSPVTDAQLKELGIAVLASVKAPSTKSQIPNTYQ